MNVNIISIDYESLASWDNYFIAAQNTVRVGQHLGQVLGVNLLVHGLKQDPKKIHLIGHSIGAHLVGHFGRVMAAAVGRIGRITGLDPAKPWFDFSDKTNSLCKDDAQIVDVIHTNGGYLLNVHQFIFERLV